MDAVTLIGLLALLFLGTHVGISSKAIRPQLIETFGQPIYRGIYVFVSLATFVPFAVAFGDHKHAGAMLWDLRGIEPLRWLAWLMMLGALVLLVAGAMNPSPASMTAPQSSDPVEVRGVLKLTRHPAFVAFALFGLAHMMMNAWVGDLIFFGSFPALSVIGGIHQDSRKLVEIGDSYRRLMDDTSFFPGLALIQGRQLWRRGDTQWGAIAIGTALTVAIVVIHPMLFGGKPLG